MNERKNNLFKEVPVAKVSRNMFDLSHEVKMSGKFGKLYPVLVMDALPGDVIRDQMTAMIRFAPMLAPVMHRCDVTTHFFFVPNRLLTEHWETFITGGQDGTDEVVLPYYKPADVAPALMASGTLLDYLGVPPAVSLGLYSQEQISILPLRAYAKIWNDFYRDPNLDDEVVLNEELEGNVSNQSESTFLFDLRYKSFEKDYFTAALPWAQRGAEVLMPLAGTGSVTYDNTSRLAYGDGSVDPDAGLLSTGLGFMKDDINNNLRVENIDEVILDSSSITINDFRRTIAIQRWLENNARGGGRYIEQVQSHFNVRVPDFRLQRAEYLGGGKQPVVISEVLATAETAGLEGQVPVGNMAGHGLSVGKSNRFSYRCQEHGFVIGILSVTYRTAYMQGLDKMWSRTTKFDYAWPELAHLGEQEILSKELYMDFDADQDANNQTVFGYIPRYSEYKFKNDRVAGDFREDLLFWHLTRYFQVRPTLVAAFTTCMGDEQPGEEAINRIFAVTDGTDYFWMQLYHRLTAKRPLPYFGVPSL